MKTILLSLLFVPLLSFSQGPDLMSYQTVVWDTGNNLVTNQLVGFQFSILQGSTTGPAVYVETQTATTNANGLASLQVGAGAVVSGDISTIDWSNGPYFFKTEADPTGGTNYTITGTSQFLSVPYALYANVADSVTNDMVDDADPDPNNEIQSMSQVGNVVTLSNGGGSVTFTSLDDDPTNELNTSATLVGTDLNITDPGGTLTVDMSSLVGTPANPTDELQDLSYANDTVYITNGAETYIGPENVIAPTLNAPCVNYGAGYGNSGFYLQNDRVFLQGLLNNCTTGAVLFTLPVGYRPVNRVILTSMANSSLARVDVLANGDVVFMSGTSGSWLALDGLSFRITN